MNTRMEILFFLHAKNTLLVKFLPNTRRTQIIILLTYVLRKILYIIQVDALQVKMLLNTHNDENSTNLTFLVLKYNGAKLNSNFSLTHSFFLFQYVLGEYRWRTATQVEQQAANFGRGLRALGHQPKQNLVIFAETRAEWMIAAHGCFKQNIPGMQTTLFRL